MLIKHTLFLAALCYFYTVQDIHTWQLPRLWSNLREKTAFEATTSKPLLRANKGHVSHYMTFFCHATYVHPFQLNPFITARSQGPPLLRLEKTDHAKMVAARRELAGLTQSHVWGKKSGFLTTKKTLINGRPGCLFFSSFSE